MKIDSIPPYFHIEIIYSLSNSIVYSINDTYFMINYVIIVIVTTVLMFSDLLKQKNIKIK